MQKSLARSFPYSIFRRKIQSIDPISCHYPIFEYTSVSDQCAFYGAWDLAQFVSVSSAVYRNPHIATQNSTQSKIANVETLTHDGLVSAMERNFRCFLRNPCYVFQASSQVLTRFIESKSSLNHSGLY